MISRRSFLVGAAMLASAPAAAQSPDPLADRFGGPFSLVTQNGRRVSDADFRGRFLLVYFGYTRCPDVCPVDLLVLSKAMEALGPEGERVQPLFITVDPARDTQALLADYLSGFHPKMLGLTGSEAEIADVVRAYKVHRVKYTPAGDPANYGIDHSSLTYLMGPDGKFRTLIPHGAGSERIAEIVRPYLLRP